ncbi:MAG: glycosyltransferase [Hyphomicrobiales bacterium]|nr:glycosyltransferase [Hyphomicrobiales bacterium]
MRGIGNSETLLASGAAILASQAILVTLAPSLTHEAATSFGVILPLIALLSLPSLGTLLLTPVLIRCSRPITALVAMLILGAAIRVVWFGSLAPLEDDFQRYLWDGGLIAQGLNPYALSPQQVIDGLAQGSLSGSVAPLASEAKHVLDIINNHTLRTIYPGTAQAAFGLAHLIAPWSLDGLRLVFLTADAATVFLLIALLRALGRSPLWAALYWCNPFVSAMLIGTAHADVLIMPFVLGAILLHIRGHTAIPCAMIGLAAGVKIWPILLAPLFLRGALRWPWRLFAGLACVGVTVAATLAPLLLASLQPQSGLEAYASGWNNNNALFMWAFEGVAAFADAPTAQATLRVTMGVLATAIAVAVAFRPAASSEDFARRALVVAAAAFYCAPAQFPWYACWFLPLAALLQFWPLMVVSALIPAYYIFFTLWGTPDFPLFSHGVALVHAIPVMAWLIWRAARYLRADQLLKPAAKVSMICDFSNIRVAVIIPAKNEAGGLPKVLRALPVWATPVIVADYNSTDGTDSVALAHGATLVRVTRPGYGAACLQAMAVLPPCDIVVFLDADGSDRPEDISELVAPIVQGGADFVLGSRTLGRCERGALTPQQRFGNWLACLLMRWIWRARFTDLGPFRAIRRNALDRLAMSDQNFGWTIEMQVRAVKHGLRWLEVPVSYRRRIGKSKVSGTLRGTIKASGKILYIIGYEALMSRTIKQTHSQNTNGDVRIQMEMSGSRPRDE